MAISQSVLFNKALSYQRIVASYTRYTPSQYEENKTAFLCHSHKDSELVKGLLVIFKEVGVDLYVDWQDQTMPEKPNGDTAKRIKEKIKCSDIFLFLATVNSKGSRWCPWEIGNADSSHKGIYIIPTHDGYNNYGNEYLELYPHIDSGTYKIDGRPGYFLTKPGETAGYAISNSNLI